MLTTKSDLLLRDVDLLTEIHQTGFLNVVVTLPSINEETCRGFSKTADRPPSLKSAVFPHKVEGIVGAIFLSVSFMGKEILTLAWALLCEISSLFIPLSFLILKSILQMDSLFRK